MKSEKNNKFILMLGEFFDRLNFYGIQSILLLYLLQVASFPKHNALSIYGAYSSLGFVLPIIGGYMVDKFLLNRYRVILVGIIFILCGDIVLFLYTDKIFTLGISLIIIGISLFKSNNAVLFGALYSETNSQKNSAFTYYYAAMNAGAITGPILYGSINIAYGWKSGLLATILGFSISFILYCLRAKYLQNSSNFPKRKAEFLFSKIILFNIFLLAGVYLCLYYNLCLISFLVGSVIVIAVLFTYIIKGFSKIEQRKIFLLLISMCYGILFYALSLQVSSSLLLYIDADVNTHIMGFTIPTQYFMSVSSVSLLILTPISVKVWGHNSITGELLLIRRVNLSIYLAAISFLLIATSALIPKFIMHGQLILIIVSLAILGFGELSIGPIVISAVTYLAPANKQGIFMGLWYLCIGYSAYISSLIAGVINSQANLISYGNIYFQNFLLIALITLVIAASMTLIRKPLANLYQN